jgi:hypothetical protein
MLQPEVTCQHYLGKECKKMEMPCVASTADGVNFRNCPILLNEIRKVGMG